MGDSPTKHKHDHSSSEEEIKEDLSVFGLGVSGKSTEASSIIGLGKKREEDPSKTNFQKHQKKLRKGHSNLGRKQAQIDNFGSFNLSGKSKAKHAKRQNQ